MFLNLTSIDPLLINSHGHKFVVLKEDDYQGWSETTHLLSSAKNFNILQKALKESIEECTDLKDVINELEC